MKALVMVLVVVTILIANTDTAIVRLDCVGMSGAGHNPIPDVWQPTATQVQTVNFDLLSPELEYLTLSGDPKDTNIDFDYPVTVTHVEITWGKEHWVSPFEDWTFTENPNLFLNCSGGTYGYSLGIIPESVTTCIYPIDSYFPDVTIESEITVVIIFPESSGVNYATLQHDLVDNQESYWRPNSEFIKYNYSSDHNGNFWIRLHLEYTATPQALDSVTWADIKTTLGRN